MSNNFDGPIILDSLADAAGAAGPGYFGTGGRTLEDSNGPRLAGGAIANIPGSATVPDGSLYMADIPALFMSLGANWVQVNSVSLDQVTGTGTATVGAQTQQVSAPGALPGDVVTATLQSDDTGGPLGAITACIVSAPGAVDVTFTAAPTNSDGVIQVVAVGTRQI